MKIEVVMNLNLDIIYKILNYILILKYQELKKMKQNMMFK